MEPQKNIDKPLGYQLRMASNGIKNYIDSYLDAHLSQRLTGIEGMTLGFLFHNQGHLVTAKDIMEHSHVSKATAYQTLCGLEKKGYLAMEPYKDDKRIKAVILTSKGKTVHEEFDSLFSVINAQIEKDITPEEKKAVESVLKKIEGNLFPEGFPCDKKGEEK